MKEMGYLVHLEKEEIILAFDQIVCVTGCDFGSFVWFRGQRDPVKVPLKPAPLFRRIKEEFGNHVQAHGADRGSK